MSATSTIKLVWPYMLPLPAGAEAAGIVVADYANLRPGEPFLCRDGFQHKEFQHSTHWQACVKNHGHSTVAYTVLQSYRLLPDAIDRIKRYQSNVL